MKRRGSGIYTIAHVLRPVSGGILRHWQALAKAATHYGFRLVLFTSCANSIQELAPYVETLVTLPLTGGVNPVRDFHSWYALRQAAQKLQLDLIHLHGFKAALIGSLALKGAAPLVYTVHNYCPGGVQGSQWIYSRCELFLAQCCTQVICVSNHLASSLAAIPGYPQALLHTIPNGIDFTSFTITPQEQSRLRQKVRTALVWSEADFIILTVARLIPAKGIATLFQAIEIVAPTWPTARFLIVGDGPEQPIYTQKALELNQKLGRSTVQLTGAVPDTLPYYAAADLFLLPSWSEGLPLSILEAGAVGLPIIATAVGGITEVIEDEVTGLLIEAQNHKSLVQALQKAQQNPQCLKNLAQKAQAKVKRAYNLNQMIDSTYQLYHNLLQSGGKTNA